MKTSLRCAVLGAYAAVTVASASAFADPAGGVQIEPGWAWTATGPYGAEVTVLAASPHDEALLLLASAKGGLFRSSDGGARWSRCEQNAADGPVPSAATCVAFDPENPAVVYAGTSGGGVFRSTDRGRGWAPIAAASGREAIHAVAVHPRRHHLVLVAATSRILRSTDGGESFAAARIQTPSDAPLAEPAVHAFAFDPFRPAHVYAASLAYGLLRSEDGGETFTAVGNGPSGLEGIALDATNGQILFAHTSREALKSLDGGLSWSRLAIEASPAPRFTALALDASRPDRVAFADASGRIFVSEDGGLSWRLAGTRALPGPVAGIALQESSALLAATACGPVQIDGAGLVSLRTAGLDDVAVRRILACGTGFGRLLAGTDLGLYESSDYGFSWSLLDVPSAPGRRSVNVLAAHPSRARVLFAGTDGGLLWTEDDGLTWRRDLVDMVVSGLAPQPGDASRTWVTGMRDGQSILLDGDPHTSAWTPARSEMGAGLPWVRVHPRRPHAIFFGGGSLLVSADGGGSWRLLPGLSGVRDLALDPFDPFHAYAATTSGLFESRDGGESWEAGELPPADIVRVVTSVSAPGLVVAVTSDGAFLRRSGASGWSLVPLAEAGELASAALDASGEALYLGGTRGVFRSAVPALEAPVPPPVRCTPNPFRGSTRILADTGSADLLGISIYSVGGGLIRTARFGPSQGPMDWEWNGRTDFGEEAASGLYLVLLHTTAGDLAGKAIKLQ